EISSAWVIGYIGPATKPWIARAMTRKPMLLASPHSSEAIENSSVAQTNRCRSPKRLARKPVSGSAIALLTANEVITQVAWLALAPRLPAMVGSDTLAIVVSSTCMNVASDRPIVASARLGGRNPAIVVAVGPRIGPALAVVADIDGSAVAGEVLADDLADQRVGLGQLLRVGRGFQHRPRRRDRRQHRA